MAPSLDEPRNKNGVRLPISEGKKIRPGGGEVGAEPSRHEHGRIDFIDSGRKKPFVFDAPILRDAVFYDPFDAR